MTIYDERGREVCRCLPKSKIFGVCARLAQLFGWNVSAVRLVTVLLAFLFPPTVIIMYLILAVLL